MNELKIFENPEFGTVRTVIIDDEPWFVGNDVARALGYSKANEAIRNNTNKEDTVLAGVSDANNHVQQMVVLNESGLYDMIFESRLPKAREFRHWVTSDVIPTIRKTGSYGVQKQDSYAIADPVERAKRWIEEQEEKKALESKISELAPKAKLCDDILDAKLLVNFRDAAKEIGISQSQFTGWLKENGYVYSTSSGELRPMEQYMESGLFKMQPYQNPYSGYKGSRTLITGRGLAAFKTLIDNSGHNRYTMKKHGGRKAV